jgi:hypothetical protein
MPTVGCYAEKCCRVVLVPTPLLLVSSVVFARMAGGLPNLHVLVALVICLVEPPCADQLLGMGFHGRVGGGRNP